MKNLCSKSKGKIYPSPSSASTSSFSSSSSVLSLLPAAILVLVSVMGCDDKEVLAYLILRSLKAPSMLLEEKKKCRKPPNIIHKPLLDCPCFDCYTSFWIRWDSSPNRELIHQAIEAFDEHLALQENSKKPRKKDRRTTGERPAAKEKPSAVTGGAAAEVAGEADRDSVRRPPLSEVDEGKATGKRVLPVESVRDHGAVLNNLSAPAPQPPAGSSRGLVRKVWPDVMGMFNSRLWGLWNPNV